MNQAEQKARIIALEQEAARDAAIGIERGERIERLETTILNLRDRVGKLEAALETWLVTVNWPDAATPPMSEMVVPAPE